MKGENLQTELSYHILDKTRERHGTDTSLGSEVVLYNKKAYRETAQEFIL